MTPLGIIITAICILVGLAIGCFIFKRLPNIFNKDKKIKEVIKNPELLLEKLKSHGKIYDTGKELDLRVGKDNETGQDVVIVEEKEVKRAREIQKKIVEKSQTKKKETKDKKKVKKDDKRNNKRHKKKGKGNQNISKKGK